MLKYPAYGREVVKIIHRPSKYDDGVWHRFCLTTGAIGKIVDEKKVQCASVDDGDNFSGRAAFPNRSVS